MRRATCPILAALVLACGGAGEPDTDLVLVKEGWISVTPLRIDLTDHEGLARFEAYQESW